MSRLINTTTMTVDAVTDVAEWFVSEGGHDDAAREQFDGTAGMLMGRKTYEGLAAYWPEQSGPWGDLLNPMPKFIASRTLQGSLDWNATAIEGDAAQGVSRLKAELDGDLFLIWSTRSGSGSTTPSGARAPVPTAVTRCSCDSSTRRPTTQASRCCVTSPSADEHQESSVSSASATTVRQLRTVLVVASFASKYLSRASGAAEAPAPGPKATPPPASGSFAFTTTSTRPMSSSAWMRRELVSVSPVVNAAEKSTVASMRPVTIRAL